MATTYQRMFVAICLAAALAAAVAAFPPPPPPVVPMPVPAQVPQPQTPVGAASFRNDLKTPVIIQGVTRLPNKMQRGAPIIIAPGKTVTEFNVPAGVRVYNIYDANQPRIKLASDVQVGVLPGRPTRCVIRQHPNAPKIAVVPE
jgi:hypothetical protein